MIMRFVRYILARGWEAKVRHPHFPCHLSKGDIIIVDGRECRIPASMRFETMDEMCHYAEGFAQ